MNTKLAIAAGAFVVTVVVAVVSLNGRDSVEEVPDETPEFPTIERDAITRLDITRPGVDDEPATTVTLTKDGDVWRVTAPVDAETDETAVSTALDKLGEMEITGVAASREENHAVLEVDDAGIQVTVHQGEGDPVELIVGAYRGRNTMVRVAGQTPVFQVSGSIKYAFNKELKDWRNRRMLDVQADRVRRVQFQSENGDYTFVRNVSGEWEPAEGQEPIERFGSSKVQSIAASIASMRAVNFAAAEVDESAAGFDTPTGTVTLSIAPEEEESDDAESDDAESDDAESDDEALEEPVALETLVLHVGGESGENNEWYVRHVGNPVIYVISTYLADRMRPGTEQFQNPEPGSEPEEPPGGMPGGMPGMPGGMPGMPGGPGGQQIPPELMQQIQQQMQQQQAAGEN